MHSKVLGFLLLVIVAAGAGCKKDAEINAAMKDLSAFTTELVRKVEAAQGAVQGIEEAQQFLDSRKEEMRKKLAILKEARGFQVSEETKRTMTDSVTQNVTRVASLQIKYVGKSIKDANYKSKIERLVRDYSALLTS